MRDLGRDYKLYDYAVEYLKRTLPESTHHFIMQLSYRDIETSIENNYDGGWSRFVSIYGREAERVTPDEELDPQIALRRRLRNLLGRNFLISACHEIIRVDADDERIRLVIRVIHEEERATRIIEKSSSIRLIVFDRATSLMIPSEGIQLDDLEWAGETYVNSHIPITDPARYTAKFWQWYECYRPGTETYPLDGYAARDTLHDEYAEFERVIKS